MKRIFLLFGFLALASAVGAQTTLEQCRQWACERYPEILRYQLIDQSARYDLSNAARAWLPRFSLSGQATWQNEVPEFPESFSGILDQLGEDFQGLRKDQYKVGLELTQTLWDGGTSHAARQVVQADADARRRETEVSLYAVQQRVDDLYFGILLLEETLRQTDQTIVLLDSNLAKVRSLLDNGVAMPSDVDALQAERLSVGQQRLQIEASRASYRRMLELFIGRPLPEHLERPSASEPADLRSARPELTLFQAQKDLLEAREQSVKSATRPRLGLFAQGYYGYPGMDFFAGMLSSDWSWNAMVGVQFSWDFGALYTRKNDLSKLRTARREIDVQQEVFQFNTDLQVAGQQGEIDRLRKALADDDRIVALRRSVRRAAESKLRNGVIDTTDLLQKITDEANARSARSAREIELLKAIYQLKYTINR